MSYTAGEFISSAQAQLNAGEYASKANGEASFGQMANGASEVVGDVASWWIPVAGQVGAIGGLAGLATEGVASRVDPNYWNKQYDAKTGEAHMVNPLSMGLDVINDGFDAVGGVIDGAHNAVMGENTIDPIYSLAHGAVCGIKNGVLEGGQHIFNAAGVELFGLKAVDVNSDVRAEQEAEAQEAMQEAVAESYQSGEMSALEAQARVGEVSGEQMQQLNSMMQAGFVDEAFVNQANAYIEQEGGDWGATIDELWDEAHEWDGSAGTAYHGSGVYDNNWGSTDGGSDGSERHEAQGYDASALTQGNAMQSQPQSVNMTGLSAAATAMSGNPLAGMGVAALPGLANVAMQAALAPYMQAQQMQSNGKYEQVQEAVDSVEVNGQDNERQMGE